MVWLPCLLLLTLSGLAFTQGVQPVSNLQIFNITKYGVSYSFTASPTPGAIYRVSFLPLKDGILQPLTETHTRAGLYTKYSDLVPDVTYRIQVVAVKRGEESTPSSVTFTTQPDDVRGSVKADEPTASPNTIGPLNEAAVIAFCNGKSVPAHLLLKPTGAESRSLQLPQQEEREQGNQSPDDDGTTHNPWEETAGLLQFPVQEVGDGQPTADIVQRSPAGVLHSHHCRPPANKAAMEALRRMDHNPSIANAVSAVCRIKWQQKENGSIHTYYCSGFFGKYFGSYFLVTCYHSFMPKENSVVRKDHVLEEIKWRCKKAEYHCSTTDLKSTITLPASDVLANHEDPVVVCDKKHDLVGILVDNPADFSRHLKPEDAAALIKIHPITLQPALVREPSLHTDWVIIPHFPRRESNREKNDKAECVELALGWKYNGVSVCQDTLMVYVMETYKGSSGSPVLYVEFEESELGSVHRMHSRTNRRYKIGSTMNELFLALLRRVAQIWAAMTRYDDDLQAF